MPGRPSPSLPTPKQIRAVHEAVAALHPGARIVKVGPEGVTFDYPDSSAPREGDWRGRPFSADPA